MNTRHLVDPELAPLLDVFPMLETSVAALPGVRMQRNAMAAATLRALPPDAVHKAEYFVPSPAGAPPVRVLVYTPAQPRGPMGALLNIHGGGMVIGTPEGDEPYNRSIAGLLNCVVVSPDYRLAPETPFPGPLDDCHAALAWMVDEAETLGIDPNRIAAGGFSAGGGLAAALALQVRDGARLKLCALVLVFPMLDDRTGSTADPSPTAGEFIWTAALNRFGWECYLGAPPGTDAVPAYAAPARHRELAGLPPTWIACGSIDLFLEENLEFTRRLARAGVATELHVYPGAYHAFMFVREASVTKTFERDYLTAIGRALAPAAAPAVS